MRSMGLLLDEHLAVSSSAAVTMAEMKPGGATDKPARKVTRENGDKPEAFDIWLQRGLHQLYDSIAKEPIPDDLLKLIEQDRSERSE